MIINYQKLREMDYVLTTSSSPLACIIRKRTSDTFFDSKIATHCGILVDIKGKFFIAEMLGNGLCINSLKKYLNNWSYQPHIVAIKRNPLFDAMPLRWNCSRDILSDYFETLKYDYEGILNYIFPNIHENPEKYYCSEYINKYAAKYGNPIVKDYKCSPYDIQMSKELIDVEDWKY